MSDDVNDTGTTDNDDAEGSTITPELVQQLRDQLAKANRESADRRHSIKLLETKVKELETAKGDGGASEVEKVQTLLDVAEANLAAATEKLKGTNRAVSLRAAIGDNKFHSVDDALALISPTEMEVDDDGNVTNAAALIKNLVKSKPYLVQAPAPKQPAPENNAGAGSSANGALDPAVADTLQSVYGFTAKVLNS